MTLKQKTSHSNKDAKKVPAAKLPKQIKKTSGLSAESMRGGPKSSKRGKSATNIK